MIVDRRELNESSILHVNSKNIICNTGIIAGMAALSILFYSLLVVPDSWRKKEMFSFFSSDYHIGSIVGKLGTTGTFDSFDSNYWTTDSQSIRSRRYQSKIRYIFFFKKLIIQFPIASTAKTKKHIICIRKASSIVEITTIVDNHI